MLVGVVVDFVTRPLLCQLASPSAFYVTPYVQHSTRNDSRQKAAAINKHETGKEDGRRTMSTRNGLDGHMARIYFFIEKKQHITSSRPPELFRHRSANYCVTRVPCTSIDAPFSCAICGNDLNPPP